MELQEGSWGKKEREVDKGVKTCWSMTIFLGFKEVSQCMTVDCQASKTAGDLSEFLAARTCASCWLDKTVEIVCINEY